VLDAWGERCSVKSAALACLAVSVFSAMWPMPNPWQHPWLFVLMQDRWHWIDYRDPPPKLDQRLHSWFRIPPRAADDAQPHHWIEFAGYEADGAIIRLRLVDRGPIVSERRNLRRVEVRWNPGSAGSNIKMLHIDEARFAAGRPPEEFLVWPDSSPTPPEQAAAIAFVRGLPHASAGYVARTVQYLKMPLRKDAYRCIRATAWSAAMADRSGPQARCDVWLSDEVPFGVVQVETTLAHPRTGEVVARRRLTAVAIGTDQTAPAARRPVFGTSGWAAGAQKSNHSRQRRP
jgi:hypothetical protein